MSGQEILLVLVYSNTHREHFQVVSTSIFPCQPLLEMVHIQDFTNASNLEPHWGYVGRILPCKNDIGSCEYLDGVYWMHDVSMLYTFILWAVIGFLLLAAIAIRILKPVQPWSSSAIVNRNEREIGSFYYRSWRSIQAILKRRLLPESFGSITRLQMTVLVILLSYLLIFS